MNKERITVEELKTKKILTLNLDKIYFNDIKNGTKIEEYREHKEYWEKRLTTKEYDYICICLGYPKKDDLEKRMFFKWSGFINKTITHPKFNNIPTKVFAIQLTQPVKIY